MVSTLIFRSQGCISSINVIRKFKEFCGILPYFGSASYFYCRMGQNIFPAICQSYINTILDPLQSRKYFKTIMDDLLLFI